MAEVREFVLPDLGEGLTEGEIVEWRVEVDEVVELNQTVVVVETAKASVEVPSPFAGRVVERLAEPGEEVAVGQGLLRIDVEAAAPATSGPDGEQTGGPGQGRQGQDDPGGGEPQPLVGYGQGRAGGGRRHRRQRRSDGSRDAAAGDGQAAAAGAGRDGGAARPLAKPPVRKLAKDLGVELSALMPGSGPGGVITREDVYAAAPSAAGTAPPSAPAAEPAEPTATGAGEKTVAGFRGHAPGEVQPVRGVRKRIVEKLTTSRREIPHALCSRDADLTAVWELGHTLSEQARAEGAEVTVTPLAIILRATVLALRRFPMLNATYDGEAGEIRLLEDINLGVAVDTDRGLLVPNIKRAQTRSTLQLARETAQLAQRCHDETVTPAELTGGTFTVDNYGAFGNDDGNPIINHPEAAILGVGAARERPWVVDGELAVRRVGRLTLAFDHRVCDGGEAGRFTTYLAELCEQPARVLLHA